MVSSIFYVDTQINDPPYYVSSISGEKVPQIEWFVSFSQRKPVELRGDLYTDLSLILRKEVYQNNRERCLSSSHSEPRENPPVGVPIYEGVPRRHHTSTMPVEVTSVAVKLLPLSLKTWTSCWFQRSSLHTIESPFTEGFCVTRV